MKKYYSFGGQTILRDSTGLQYFPSTGSGHRLTDHLGSVVAVTDDDGTLTSQQRYLPFGSERTDVGTIAQTDYGYTGQRDLSMGLMDYKARFYSPYLNHFSQPDTLIPNLYNPQSLNRYSYVTNNPVNFIDPSGHCEVTGEEDSDNCHAPSKKLPKSQGGGGGLNCGIQCTLKEIQDASFDERFIWFQGLQENMDENIRPGAGNWFRNIATVVVGFAVTGQDSNAWALNIDATILYELQEGYAAFLIGESNGLTNGGSEWIRFFELLDDSETTEQQLINQWGYAEFSATNDALREHGMPGFFSDDNTFLSIGNVYRVSQFTYCSLGDCVERFGGFFDPRSSFSDVFGGNYNNMSPVAAALVPIYFGDYRNFR